MENDSNSLVSHNGVVEVHSNENYDLIEDDLSVSTIDSDNDQALDPASTSSVSQIPDKENTGGRKTKGKPRGKNKDQYESNVIYRSKYASRKMNSMCQQLREYKTVTGSKGLVALEHINGHGKIVKRIEGDRDHFVDKNTQVFEHVDDLSTVLVETVKDKLGVILSTLTSSSDVPNILDSSSNNPTVIGLKIVQFSNTFTSPTKVLKKKRRSTLGSCLKCGKDGLIINGKEYNAISVVCSHGSGRSACNGSVHLYCLGFFPKSEDEAASMPDYYCELHKHANVAGFGMVVQE